MALRQGIHITLGGKERITESVAVLAPAFHDDPVFTYFLGSLPENKRMIYLSTLLTVFVKACTLNAGHVLEAGSWGSCAVLMPPGAKADNPFTILQAGVLSVLMILKISGCKKILLEYTSAAERAKAKGMTKHEQAAFWYLFIIGTAPVRQRQGVAGALINRMKDLARRDGRPLWLEATTTSSRQLYAKHGFQDVDEIVLGKGQAGPDGLAKEGGEGVTIWGMVWRPEKI
ncbi:hypothetical protein F5X99DRAFT_298314 [Biscogniauxia marginata]|nr:hypothetical protein F5X99DRAFT_298314 [Biscogniauxia marginata]